MPRADDPPASTAPATDAGRASRGVSSGGSGGSSGGSSGGGSGGGQPTRPRLDLNRRLPVRWVNLPLWWALLTVGVAVAFVMLYTLVDRRLAVALHDSPWEGLGSTVGEFTSAGWMMITAAVLAGICWWRNWRRLALRLLMIPAALLATGAVVQGLKVIFGRWRPNALWVPGDMWGFEPLSIGYKLSSFPSGHAANLACLATLATLHWPRLWPAWFTLATIGASARILSESHYASDVIVGLYVGAMVTWWVGHEWRKHGLWSPDAGPMGSRSPATQP